MVNTSQLIVVDWWNLRREAWSDFGYGPPVPVWSKLFVRRSHVTLPPFGRNMESKLLVMCIAGLLSKSDHGAHFPPLAFVTPTSSTDGIFIFKFQIQSKYSHKYASKLNRGSSSHFISHHSITFLHFRKQLLVFCHLLFFKMQLLLLAKTIADVEYKIELRIDNSKLICSFSYQGSHSCFQYLTILFILNFQLLVRTKRIKLMQR